MAKEQLHNWGRYLVIAVAVVFAGGGYVMKIVGNTNAIIEVKHDTRVSHREMASDIENNEDKIHALELKDKDLVKMAETSLQFMTQMDGKLDTVINAQTEQATVQAEQTTGIAVMSEKLKQLTKDK